MKLVVFKDIGYTVRFLDDCDFPVLEFFGLDTDAVLAQVREFCEKE